jgi:hypothetical protein
LDNNRFESSISASDSIHSTYFITILDIDNIESMDVLQRKQWYHPLKNNLAQTKGERDIERERERELVE